MISSPEQAAHPGIWGFKPEEPGRYEFKYRVHLSPRLEEENKDNNEAGGGSRSGMVGTLDGEPCARFLDTI